MFDQLRDFLNDLVGGESERPDADDPRIAAVALFFHVIGVDGVVDEAESSKLKSLIVEEYGLDGEEMRRLLAAGAEAEKESVDLYAFTSVLNRKLEPGAKVHFIELLWKLAYADGERHELEDHVVWRIADLMGVSSRDRVLARQRASAEAGSVESSED